MKKFIASVGVLLSCFTVYAATSPVVQVVSYKEPLGLYYLLQGWGSGSIIDNMGHIITNNHVVDNGLGGISDDFAICMTEDPALPPRCHYTASVISRDADADVAILQIDSTDIFGKKVDFSTLSPLPMNMRYVPKSGDTVLARGYPWIGANTITETKGIVSGTAQYNGKRYIKTDTLIAGGNSGGPLIQDGQMIGVNTFLVGGGYDPSLAYSLLISEVADFVRETLLKTSTIQSNNPQFPKFLQNMDLFSSQQKIVDPLITIDLPEKYTILSYIPSTTITASLSDTNTTSVDSFGFFHTRTPRITNLSELKNYILSDVDVSTRGDYAFTPIILGGKNFYEIQYGKETDMTKTKNTYNYVSIIDETHLLYLYLSTPDPTQNTLDKIQKSVKYFLGHITFPTVFTFPKTQNLHIPEASLSILTPKNAMISYDIQEYSGLLEGLIINKQDFVIVRNFLGNISLYAQIAVFKNSFETEDDTVDTWLEKSTQYLDTTPVVKKKVTYKGHEGFLVCTQGPEIDDRGKPQATTVCESVFFFGAKKDFIMSFRIILPSTQSIKIDTIIQQYLDKTLQIPLLGDTDFPTQKPLKPLLYSDIGDQSELFQEVLGQLLSYGVLAQRPMFEGESPLTWKEYISLYVWAIYHRRMSEAIDVKNPASPTFEKALAVLPISWSEYAESEEFYLNRLHNLIRLIIAGGSLPSYDFVTVSEFDANEYNRDAYTKEWNKIDAFEAKYFPSKVFPKPAKYISQFLLTYNPLTGLVKKPKHDSEVRDRFFRNSTQEKTEIEQLLRCERSSVVYFSPECIAMRKTALMELLTYTVLTKGKAIEIILQHMDYTLWDPSLIQKNDIQ